MARNSTVVQWFVQGGQQRKHQSSELLALCEWKPLVTGVILPQTGSVIYNALPYQHDIMGLMPNRVGPQLHECSGTSGRLCQYCLSYWTYWHQWESHQQIYGMDPQICLTNNNHNFINFTDHWGNDQTNSHEAPLSSYQVNPGIKDQLKIDLSSSILPP